MTKKRKTGVRELRKRLQTAEDTVRAITTGEVDALVVAHGNGEQVITLAGAELAYRILFDQMNEGAVTLTREGTIAYCNRRFAAIVQTPLARVIGEPLGRFVARAEQGALEAMLQAGSRENARADLHFRTSEGASVPVEVSLAPLRAEAVHAQHLALPRIDVLDLHLGVAYHFAVLVLHLTLYDQDVLRSRVLRQA